MRLTATNLTVLLSLFRTSLFAGKTPNYASARSSFSIVINAGVFPMATKSGNPFLLRKTPIKGPYQMIMFTGFRAASNALLSVFRVIKAISLWFRGHRHRYLSSLSSYRVSRNTMRLLKCSTRCKSLSHGNFRITTSTARVTLLK